MAHVCIDIDNVIAGTDEVMRRVIEDYTHGLVRLTYEDIKTFNYYDCRDRSGNGINKEQWTAVHEIFSEPRYLWLIQPIAGSLEGLRRIAERATLHLATSRLPTARRVTVEWLESHGVPRHNLHFLKHGEKHVVLSGIVAAVEDDYEQAKAFASHAKVRCFLLRHPWNQTEPRIDGVQWVENWEDLTERLLLVVSSAG